jgi:hypothetical protein
MRTHCSQVAPPFVVVAILAALLGGCAVPKGWHKSGGSAKEFAEVQQACLDAGAVAPEAFEGCMGTKGWERAMLRGFYGLR